MNYDWWMIDYGCTHLLKPNHTHNLCISSCCILYSWWCGLPLSIEGMTHSVLTQPYYLYCTHNLSIHFVMGAKKREERKKRSNRVRTSYCLLIVWQWVSAKKSENNNFLAAHDSLTHQRAIILLKWTSIW